MSREVTERQQRVLANLEYVISGIAGQFIEPAFPVETRVVARISMNPDRWERGRVFRVSHETGRYRYTVKLDSAWSEAVVEGRNVILEEHWDKLIKP